MKRRQLMALLLVCLMTLVLLTGCKKEDPKTEAEKVFTLEKETTEAATTGSQTESLSYVLYLKVGETAFLMDDLQTVPENETALAKVNMPLYALNKLLTFETTKNLLNPIPTGTTLLKLELIDGLAKVDLSKAFVPASLKKEDAQLAIAAIVNTLTYFSEVDAVELYVEGVRLTNYFGFDTSESLVFFEGLYPEK